jgi:hypothetical protein
MFKCSLKISGRLEVKDRKRLKQRVTFTEELQVVVVSRRRTLVSRLFRIARRPSQLNNRDQQNRQVHYSALKKSGQWLLLLPLLLPQRKLRNTFALASPSILWRQLSLIKSRQAILLPRLLPSNRHSLPNRNNSSSSNSQVLVQLLRSPFLYSSNNLLVITEDIIKQKWVLNISKVCSM